jgi:hypothetical protein
MGGSSVAGDLQGLIDFVGVVGLSCVCLGDDQPVSSGDSEWDESDLDSLGLKFMLNSTADSMPWGLNSTLDAGSTQIKSPGAFQIPRPPQLSIPLLVDDTDLVVSHEDANKTAVGNMHVANSVETNRTILNLETNQPPPPVNSTLSHSPIIPFRIDANLETVVPQDMKFKTAFELYDPARATSLSRGFQKFCRYRHLHPSKEVSVFISSSPWGVIINTQLYVICVTLVYYRAVHVLHV